jgi:4-hydroxy-tetrahydrodipicolinate synthase
MARFGEVLTAMVTPFDTDRSLNLESARKLTSYLIDNGSDGLVVCGTTGESPTLTHDEKLALFRAVIEEAGGRAKVVAGTGTNNTAESVALTREVNELGVDGVLVVTPYYSKPPQNGLLEHFRAVADASRAPVMVYDIPGRTGRRIERPTMVELAAHERIVADKDAVGDAGETARLRNDLDEAGANDFEIYSGDDPLLLPHLAAGAVGIVSVCSHLIGPQIKSIVSDFNGGRLEAAQRTYSGLLPLMATIMGITASPIPVKAALNMIGLEVGPPRLPLVEPTEEESRGIRAALESAGLL